MKTAIVLSGGGSKGDFEVGALHFLYDRLGIRPDVIVSCSVGSVNALKLAEGEGAPDQGLAGLTSMWLERNSQFEFFIEASWVPEIPVVGLYFRQFLRDHALRNTPTVELDFAINPTLEELHCQEVEAIAGRLKALLPAVVSNPDPFALVGTPLAAIMMIPSLANTLGAAISGLQLWIILRPFLSNVLATESLFTYAPLEALARQAISYDRINAWSESGKRLLMATVALKAGVLRYVDQNGRLLERDLTPVEEAGAMSPQCQGLANKVVEYRNKLRGLQAQLIQSGRDNGTDLLTAVCHTQMDLSKALRDLKRCQDDHPTQASQEPVRVDLVSGMIASASIPGYVPARTLYDDDYVDGGIRAVLPTEGAVLTGSGKIYAIQASKLAADFDELSPGLPPLIRNTLRSLPDLAINEISLRDANPVLPPGVQFTRIEPRVDIHTLFSLYPAFVRIRMAYGWMCAADETTTFSTDKKEHERILSEARAIADKICKLRYGATRLEAWLTNNPVPPMMVNVPAPQDRQGTYQTLVTMKQQIASLVAQRRAISALLPDGTGEWDDPARWSFGYEVHPWNRQPVDDGTVDVKSVPSDMKAGGSARVTVSVFNSGNTVWHSAQGVRLGSANPPDSMTWGIKRVDLPGSVHPGQEIVISFTIAAPAQAGTFQFAWQMVREGVAWFGFANEPRSITVTTGTEPAECSSIRSQIADRSQKIQNLSDQLGSNPQADARIRAEITRLNTERSALIERGTALGCVL